MTEDKTDLWALTNDEIDAMGPVELRAAAEKHLSDYSRYRIVASFDLTVETLATPGALSAVDNLLAVLRKAHAEHDPVVHKRYGDSIELRVWASDETLRSSLRYQRRQAEKVAEEQETESSVGRIGPED